MRIYCSISIFMTDEKGIVEVLRNRREVGIDCKCQVSNCFVREAVPLGTWCLSLEDNELCYLTISGIVYPLQGTTTKKTGDLS
jgi:hypothetical protein